MNNQELIIKKILELKAGLPVVHKWGQIHEATMITWNQSYDEILFLLDSKPIIDINHVIKITNERTKINNLKLSECDFIENGVKIEIPQEMFDEWAYSGLNNIDFIKCRFWETGWIQEDTENTLKDENPY